MMGSGSSQELQTLPGVLLGKDQREEMDITR